MSLLSSITVQSALFLNNPAKWTDGYQVQITFEAHEDLDKDVEWQLIYVASPTNETNDQTLEKFATGPVAKGRHQFVLEAPAPEMAKIKDPHCIHDVTLLLLKGFYAKKRFTKVGWFVTNEYEDPELQAAKPKVPQVDKLKREIQIKDVRVTQFPNAWREEEPPVVPGADEDEEIAFNTADPLPEDDDDYLDDDDVREENAEVDGRSSSASSAKSPVPFMRVSIPRSPKKSCRSKYIGRAFYNEFLILVEAAPNGPMKDIGQALLPLLVDFRGFGRWDVALEVQEPSWRRRIDQFLQYLTQGITYKSNVILKAVHGYTALLKAAYPIGSSAPLVVVTSMEILNNPAKWTDGYQVQITFEAHEDLDKDVEWQLIYVASPTNETNDQILEEVAIGPIVKGRHQFVLEAPAPDPAKIKDADYIHDITLLLLKCFYAEKMFTKVGWFVTNEYEDPELQAAKPKVPQVEKLKRQIQIKDVRVTQFSNAWEEEDEAPVVPGADDDKEIAFNTADPLSEADDDDLDDDDVREENAEVDGDIDNTMEVDENTEKLKDVVLADE